MLLHRRKGGIVTLLFAVGSLGFAASAAEAAVRVEGQVQAGGGPVAGSTVSLWAATANAPARLNQATTGADGGFAVSVDQTPAGATLYLTASGGTPAANKQGGDNPAIALHDGARQQAAGQGDHQRNDDHRLGLDACAVHRRHGDQRATRSACASPPATCRTSSISRPAATAA